MMTVLDELGIIIKEQQAGRENTPAFTVGLQLLDIAEHEPASAELLLKDLSVEGMKLDDAAKQLKDYADKNHGRRNCFCITPDVAESILRKFYGLPERGEMSENPTPEKAATEKPTESFIDLSSFL